MSPLALLSAVIFWLLLMAVLDRGQDYQGELDDFDDE